MEAEAARRLDELGVLQHQHLGPDQPRIGDPADQRERDEEVGEPRPEHADDGDARARRRGRRR